MSGQKRSVGRPSVVTDEVLRLLEMAFAIGATDEEACAFAEIGTTSLYEYQLRNPEFAERKERLKLRPILKARAKVDAALERDAELAFKFLERKRRDEFAPRLEMTGKGGGALELGIASIIREASQAQQLPPHPEAQQEQDGRDE